MTTPFTCLKYPFAIDGVRGRVAEEPDFDAHIRQLLLQVLLTSPGERINRPDFGCGVKRLLFAPNGEVSAALARSVIYQALDRWLGTAITVQEVVVSAGESTLDIRIGYVVKARGQRQVLNLQVNP